MAFDSLFIGVTGLTSYQNQIDVISNNIANVGTVGYKGQDVTFQDLLYSTQGYASAPTTTRGGINAQQVGDGVKIGSIDTNWSQGGLQTTGVNTNLAINGNGFFVLRNIDGSGTPSYTRDGDFSLNEDGYLYDPTSGLGVLGYTPNAQGVISQIAPPQPLQIPLGLKSQAVGTGYGAKSGPAGDTVFDISFGGNLNQTDYITAVSTAVASPTNTPTINVTTITTTIYDSLGGAHEVQIGYQPATAFANGGMTITGTTAINNIDGVATTVATEWKYNVVSTDGSTLVPTASSGYIWFDQNGQFVNTSATGQPTGGALISTQIGVHQANTNPTGTALSTDAGDQLGVLAWGTPNLAPNANNAATVPTVAAPGVIGLDFSNMSALNATATADTISQNGYVAGTLSNITVGQDGTITGAFTNGQNKVLGALAIAAFQNESGLVRTGNNQFVQSPNSGLAQYGFAGTGTNGTIDAGALEQSNVSIASEFTKMILAQRAFEANAKSITTADQNLQTVIGLKQ